jgi:hypothetical protein
MRAWSAICNHCAGADRLQSLRARRPTAIVARVPTDFEARTRQLQEAVQQQDHRALDALLAPGFRLITSRAGNPTSRDEWIAAAVGPFRLASYAIDDLRVIDAGATTVVVTRITQDARLGDQSAARNWLMTDVWTRSAARWQLIARHAEALADG